MVEIEPILREANPANNIPAVYADLTVNGIWEVEKATFYDVRFLNNTDTLTLLLMVLKTG